MVYKCPFLKQRVIKDYDPAADGTFTWDLSDEAMAALWLTIKGDFVAADECVEDLMDLVTSLDVWLGSFNVVHYIYTRSAVMMNCKLKGNRYMEIGNGQAIDDIKGISFPILFGSPYINSNIGLPKDLSNRKKIILGLDIADSSFDDLLISIDEVLMPDARPTWFIRQQEYAQSALGTGDHDIWLQTNWDILKILFKVPTAPDDDSWTTTINYSGTEINDFPYGYKAVDWETLHGEIMDELGGLGGLDNHFHADPSSGNTGYPENLETWERVFGEMDYFHDRDPKWRLPCAGASSAKIKLNTGVDEAFWYTLAEYCPVSKVM